ncbi:hypothetical protein [Paenibacillus sp. ISL-20]|uniref:hypothetical protein n=1 Tax=Paenibacillus sp. ISL-20 TaxID=2819163 RepID=UPI001BE5C3F0|nr:hypothetical protein [Paenibacillus sp. ISL-20]MBT2763383.1 hypothetical protein [Paenibacillus sp. ISL-20]
MSLGHKELTEQLELRKKTLLKRLIANPKDLTYEEFIEIKELYAVIYSMFHTIQKHCKDNELYHVPVGDQITGVLGEAFILRYLNNKYRVSKTKPKFAKNSSTSQDIEYHNDDDVKIIAEVKTTSYYSEKRSSTPIGSEWQELYFVYLDQHLNPVAVWKIRNREGFLNFLDPKDTRKVRIPKPNSTVSGTKEVFLKDNCFAEPITDDFLKYLNQVV